jgi:hypothetical protein
LKLHEDFILPLTTREKKAEFRKDDRGYEVGDYLLMTTPDELRCLATSRQESRSERT